MRFKKISICLRVMGRDFTIQSTPDGWQFRAGQIRYDLPTTAAAGQHQPALGVDLAAAERKVFSRDVNFTGQTIEVGLAPHV